MSVQTHASEIRKKIENRELKDFSVLLLVIRLYFNYVKIVGEIIMAALATQNTRKCLKHETT